jgi:TonB family protein
MLFIRNEIRTAKEFMVGCNLCYFYSKFIPLRNLIPAILFFIGTAEFAVAQKDPLNHEMIFVEGGTFQMGSSSGESDEKPVHSVTLSAFNIGKYEVTQAQWKVLMGSNPSHFKDCDDCPVEYVSWDEVQGFIRNLNALSSKNYRLPTEAEWEFSARGGKSSKGFTYSGSNDLNAVAWNADNSGSKTHAVGGKQANELGIYDMSGNACEWCCDWYGKYNSYSETNPTGASSGQYSVLRGGSWNFVANLCRTARRGWYNPDYGSMNFGFRLVLPVEDESKSEIQTETIKTDEEPLTYVEQDAEYPGGSAALYKLISENLVYPEDAVENGIEGKVIVKFVVDIDGVAKDFEIERTSSGGQSLERAAIEVCKRLGKFKPAMQKGKPVKSYFSQAIVFQLAD